MQYSRWRSSFLLMSTTDTGQGLGWLFAPLRVSKSYRSLMLGQFATQAGVWVLTVAAQIFMVQRGESTLIVALVQSAVTLPFLVFTIPAGVIADLMSRRMVLIVTNLVAAAVGILLTVLSALGILGAGTLLALVFLLGLAWALNAPSFSAMVPDVISRDYLPPAGMLSSITFNAARVVGPAIGGLVVAFFNPTLAFAVGTVGYLIFAVAVFTVKAPTRRSASNRFFPALRTGFRHVVNAHNYRRTVIVAGAWFICGGALFALLPIVALRELGFGAGQYGWVLAVLGGGAVVGTILLAPFRARVQASLFVSIIMPVFAVCLVLIGTVHVAAVIYVVLAIAGAAWTAVGAVLLALAQQLLPGWVRARGLAYYFMASQGGLAAGAFLWGVVADRTSVAIAMTIAGVAVIPTWLVALTGRFPEVSVAGDAPGWPLPDADLPPEILDQRAHVAVTWRVPPERREAFIEAMELVRRSRRRTGGRHWVLANDIEDTDLYVESWVVDSWHDHLEQHEVRQELEDAAAVGEIRAIAGEPVEVRHYVEIAD